MALGLALLLAARARFSVPRGDLALGLALVAGALALRLGLGAWGPLHVNGQGPLWILGAAVEPSALAFYGKGYPELFGLVTRLGPADTAIYSANALLSALTVGLAFAFARAAGLERARALLAATLLALDPFAIRIATTEAYFIPIVALTVGASLAAVIAANRAAEGARLAALTSGLIAALLCAVTVRIHPVSWPVVALVPAAALSCRLTVPLGRRLLWMVVIGLEVLLLIAVTDGRDLLWHAHAILAGETFQPSVGASFSTLALAALGGAALLRARPRGLALSALGPFVAGVLLSHNYSQSVLWERSFDHLYLTLPVVACAALVPPAWAARRNFRLGAGLLLVAGFAVTAPFVLRGRTTQHREYVWLRGWFARLPADCRELHVGAAGKLNWFAPTYLASRRDPNAFVSADLRQPFDPRRLAVTGCAYYVRSSLCSLAEGRAACDEVERNFTLEPVAEASFPAVPDHYNFLFEGPSVPVRIFRVLATR
jgi:hypothetical protein